jgi:hypothetical protein
MYYAVECHENGGQVCSGRRYVFIDCDEAVKKYEDEIEKFNKWNFCSCFKPVRLGIFEEKPTDGRFDSYFGHMIESEIYFSRKDKREQKMKYEIKVNNYMEREKLVSILTENGYTVKTEKKKMYDYPRTEHCFVVIVDEPELPKYKE